MTAPGSGLFWLVVFWAAIAVGCAAGFAWLLCRVAADADRRSVDEFGEFLDALDDTWEAN